MKVFIITVVVIVLALAGFVLDLLRDAGEFKKIEPHFSGTIQKVEGVIGPEDITFHPEKNIAFISSYDRRALSKGQEAQGAIYAYDLRDGELINLTENFEKEFHPHGLSFHLGKDGLERLFVVNHQDMETHCVEIFDYEQQQLIHRESIMGKLMHSPNDVVAVGPRSFYVTNDHGSVSNFGRTLEEYLRLAKSYVLHYDGEQFQKAAEGLKFANGINKSQDNSKIYVAATTSGKIHVYDRDDSSAALESEQQIDLDTGVDNIEVDESGNLWIAAHPKLLTFVNHANDPSKQSPSQVLKISPAAGDKYQIEEVFLDDGRNISASSVAAVSGRTLLIGAVFQDGFLVCEL